MIETGDIQVIIEDGTNANLCQQIAYIKAGKTEIEEAVQEGVGDFNTNATEKTNTFNSNASAKTLAFNQNADAKTAVYDNNASEKLSAYNENATNKLAAYNANDTAKTEAYNLNATNKTTAFNNNASEKTSTFNDNAIAKTNGFNSNATSKTNDFNSNASSKTTAFNDNYTAKKALIDAEVQTAKDWATKTDGTVDGVDYSAKYYAQSILPIKDDITAVAGIATDVSDVADIKDEVTAVANDKANIDTVANDITNVNTVAGDHANIQTVVNNMTAINNAPTYANNSKIWAEGLDGEVTPLGGTHSAKGWAEIAEQAASGVQNPANRDLSNLTAAGQMIIDSQNGTISNCILEIPQDINLTLESGTLTLKAGSKTYVPNGTGTFDAVTTASDLTTNYGYASQKVVVALNTDGTMLLTRPLQGCVSGSGATTISGLAYDTTANQIDYYNSSGNIVYSKTSFPICIGSCDSSGNITLIDKVFNGFGYIGSTVFCLSGVKCLIPFGRNTGGTLKSTSFTTSAVGIGTVYGTHNKDYICLINNNTLNVAVEYDYNAETNYVYNKSTKANYTNRLLVGRLSSTSGTITSFDIRKPVRLVTAENDNTFTGNNTFTGDNIFAPFTLSAENPSDIEGGEIRFSGGSQEPNSNYIMRLDRYDGAFRFFGADSNGEIRIPLTIDIENNTARGVTPATSDNSTKIATTAWFHNNMTVVSTDPVSPTAGVFYFVTTGKIYYGSTLLVDMTLSNVTGYDATKTQTLKNVSGTLTWVDD